MESDLVAVALPESVTWAVKVKGLPVVVVGVPVIAPVEVFNVRPPGSAPEVINHV